MKKDKSYTPKVITKKNAEIIVDYLNIKLSDFTDGLNYWGREQGKTYNSVQRQLECAKTISHIQSAYDEVYSMFIQLKTNYNL